MANVLGASHLYIDQTLSSIIGYLSGISGHLTNKELTIILPFVFLVFPAFKAKHFALELTNALLFSAASYLIQQIFFLF